MNRIKGVAKYNICSALKSLKLFYLIFGAIIIMIEVINNFFGGGGKIQGIEFSSMIYLFCIGACLFREGFYFCQGNNVSREDFYKGSLLTSGILSVFMVIVAMIFNGVINIFTELPGLYDMAFLEGGFAEQKNFIFEFIFLLILFIFAFQIGSLFAEVYFRLQKRGQIIFSVVLILSVMIIGNADEISFANNILNAIASFFSNPYMLSLGFLAGLIIISAFNFVLVKGAEVNK